MSDSAMNVAVGDPAPVRLARLIRMELRRCLARRLTYGVFAIIAAVMTIFGVSTFFTDDTFRYAQSIPDATEGLGTFLMPLVGIVLGASYVGAEWGARTMETLLTWEPRRALVLAAKFVAGTVASFALAVVVLVFLAAVHLPAGLADGTVQGTDWGSVAGTWVRSGLAAGFGAIGAMALATVFRNTAGAIVVWLVYLQIGEQLLWAWRREQIVPWLVSANLSALVGGDAAFDPRFIAVSAPRASVVLAVYAAALIGIGYVSFRRDVT